MSNKKAAIIVLGVGALLAVLALLVRSEERGGPKVIRVDASYTAEFGKPEVLAREVDNLFIGSILEVSGTHYIGGSSIPSTLYRVEVLESWKGEARGTISVSQDSGFDEKQGVLYLTNGDKLLEPGGIYLFATNDQAEWQTLVPIFGDIPVKNEQERVALRDKFAKFLSTPE